MPSRNTVNTLIVGLLSVVLAFGAFYISGQTTQAQQINNQTFADRSRSELTEMVQRLSNIVNTLQVAAQLDREAGVIPPEVTQNVNEALSNLGEMVGSDQASQRSDSTPQEDFPPTDQGRQPDGLATGPTSLACSAFGTNLSSGDSGPAVRNLQEFLNSHPGTALDVPPGSPGSAGNETDYFGPATVDAVERFQDRYADEVLEPLQLNAPTGVWGSSSRTKARELCRQDRFAQRDSSAGQGGGDGVLRNEIAGVEVRNRDGSPPTVGQRAVSRTPADDMSRRHNMSPEVTVTSPADGHHASEGESVTMHVEASDSDGRVIGIKFFADQELIDVDSQPPFTAEFMPSASSHKLTAKAFDNRGTFTVSDPVTVTSPNPKKNTASPSISLTSPSAGDTFTVDDTVRLDATADDPDGVVSEVVFYVGNVKVGSDTVAPFSTSYAPESGGSKQLTAKAIDNDGAANETAPTTITIQSSTQAPSVNLVSPSNGASFTASDVITLRAAAGNATGNISQIAFFVDGTRVGTDATSPYSVFYTPQSDGTKQLTVEVTDTNGQTSTADTRTVSVQAQNQSPAVTLTSPSSDTTLTSGNAVELTATANDQDGSISQVEFFVDGTRVGTDATSPYSVSYTPSETGAVQLTAKATDDNNASTESGTTQITVEGTTGGQVLNADFAVSTRNLQVDFRNQSSDANGFISSHSWDFGDGNTSTLPSPMYSYSSAGTYTVELTVTDNDGNTGSVTKEVTVGSAQPPTADVVATPQEGTAPLSVSFDGSGSSDPDQDINRYTWSFGDGTVTSGQTANHTYDKPGTYHPELVVHDRKGRADTASATITVRSPNQPPSVNLSSPSDGASFTTDDTITLEANANDSDGNVAQVEFFVNGVSVGTGDSNAFSTTYTPSSVGTKKVTAQVTDDDGASTETGEITINIEQPNQAPSIEITNPSDGTSFGTEETVTLKASANDPDGDVSEVEFFVDGTSVGTDTNAPFSASYTPQNGGSKELTAQATDGDGDTGEASPVAITVESPNQSPTVDLTNPSDGDTFTAGDTVSLKADASDSDGSVAEVEFFVNGTSVGTDGSSPYSVDYTPPTTGTKELEAKVTDNESAASMSGSVSITVETSQKSSGSDDTQQDLNIKNAWSDPSTWGDGQVPQKGDLVTIPSGKEVTLDISPPQLEGVKIEGKLRFARKDLELTADYIIAKNGGEFRIGTADSPFEKQATITLTDKYGGENSNVENCGYKVLCSHGGSLELHGTTKRNDWTKLADGNTAKPGDTSIQVDNANGWQKGDEIVIVSSSYNPGLAERRTITNVSGNTVSFSNSLEHRHHGKIYENHGYSVDERAEVMNLTRNILIRGSESSDTTHFGGHVMVMNEHASQQFSRWSGGNGEEFIDIFKDYTNDPQYMPQVTGVEFDNLGQTGHLARYPFHWHVYGNAGKSTFASNSIHDSKQRCVTIHNTSNVTVKNNVAFDVIGHCYFLEDGLEFDNTLKGNIGALVKNFPDPDLRLEEHDRTPSVYWWSNPQNNFIGNVAAGSFGFGFWLDPQKHPKRIGATDDIRLDSVRGNSDVDFGTYEDNVVHSTVRTIQENSNPGNFDRRTKPGNMPFSGVGFMVFDNQRKIGDQARDVQCARDTDPNDTRCDFKGITAYYNKMGFAAMRSGYSRPIGGTFANNQFGVFTTDRNHEENNVFAITDNIGNPGTWGEGSADMWAHDGLNQQEQDAGRSMPPSHDGDGRMRQYGISWKYDGGVAKGNTFINYKNTKNFHRGAQSTVGNSHAVYMIDDTMINSRPHLEEGGTMPKGIVIADPNGTLTGTGVYTEIRQGGFPPQHGDSCVSAPDSNDYSLCSGHTGLLHARYWSESANGELEYRDVETGKSLYGGMVYIPTQKTYDIPNHPSGNFIPLQPWQWDKNEWVILTFKGQEYGSVSEPGVYDAKENTAKVTTVNEFCSSDSRITLFHSDGRQYIKIYGISARKNPNFYPTNKEESPMSKYEVGLSPGNLPNGESTNGIVQCPSDSRPDLNVPDYPFTSDRLQ